jgi:hypothetical protein
MENGRISNIRQPQGPAKNETFLFALKTAVFLAFYLLIAHVCGHIARSANTMRVRTPHSPYIEQYNKSSLSLLAKI